MEVLQEIEKKLEKQLREKAEYAQGDMIVVTAEEDKKAIMCGDHMVKNGASGMVVQYVPKLGNGNPANLMTALLTQEVDVNIEEYNVLFRINDDISLMIPVNKKNLKRAETEDSPKEC